MSQVLRERLQPSVVISALKGTGMDAVRDLLADQLRHRNQRMRLRIPHSEGRLLASLRTAGTLFSIAYEDDHTVLDVAVPPRLAGACEPFRMDGEPDSVE